MVLSVQLAGRLDAINDLNKHQRLLRSIDMREKQRLIRISSEKNKYKKAYLSEWVKEGLKSKKTNRMRFLEKMAKDLAKYNMIQKTSTDLRTLNNFPIREKTQLINMYETILNKLRREEREWRTINVAIGNAPRNVGFYPR